MLKDNKLSTFHSVAIASLNAIYPERECKALLYWLYEDCLHMHKTEVVLDRDRRLTESEIIQLQQHLKDLLNGKPIQQILGYAYFGDLKLKINRHTLIPRPETYELAMLIINELRSAAPLRFLDIGTGSGCIPIALASAMPQHHYTAWDISNEALKIAIQNTQLHQLNISLVQQDLFQNTDFNQFDIIVSNPPYIPLSEKATMDRQVKDYEPTAALFVPDNKALLFYEKIIEQVLNSQNSKILYCEIHEVQKTALTQLFQQYNIKEYQFYKDIHTKDRFFKAIIN